MSHRLQSTDGQRIRDEIAALTNGPRRRYPARLQQQIVAYARTRLREGAARARVSTELGVSDPTLSRLLGGKADGPQLRPVRLVREATRDAAEVSRLVVRTPGGLVVEGLDIVGIAALVRALS